MRFIIFAQRERGIPISFFSDLEKLVLYHYNFHLIPKKLKSVIKFRASKAPCRLNKMILLLYDLWKCLFSYFPGDFWPSLVSAVVLPTYFSSAQLSIYTGDAKKTFRYLCVCPTGEFVKNIYAPDGTYIHTYIRT